MPEHRKPFLKFMFYLVAVSLFSIRLYKDGLISERFEVPICFLTPGCVVVLTAAAEYFSIRKYIR